MKTRFRNIQNVGLWRFEGPSEIGVRDTHAGFLNVRRTHNFFTKGYPREWGRRLS
jgi:hypothetical protein